LRQYLAYHKFLTFLNFHSLRISIIYVSILAFCQVLLNVYDDDDDDDDDATRTSGGSNSVRAKSLIDAAS